MSAAPQAWGEYSSRAGIGCFARRREGRHRFRWGRSEPRLKRVARADRIRDVSGEIVSRGRERERRDLRSPQNGRRAPLTSVRYTRVRVTNLENGRSVDVRIIDRGPHGQNFREGTIIDLSRAAATRLDMIEDGQVRVKVRVLRLGDEGYRSPRERAKTS